MFLDKYKPADHDLYSYEFDTNDSTVWTDFDYNILDGIGNTIKVNRPTGFNTNCLLEAYGTDSPPWHKISVSDRRLNFLATDYILDDSVKDRYIKNNFSDWRTTTNTEELHLANTWNSGSVHFIPISDRVVLCSRTALEDAITRPDITMKRNRNNSNSTSPGPAHLKRQSGIPEINSPGFFHEGGSPHIKAFMGWAGAEKEVGGEDTFSEKDEISNDIRFLDNSGNIIKYSLNNSQALNEFTEGGFSPKIKDLSQGSSPQQNLLLHSKMWNHDYVEDNSKMSKDIMVLQVSDSETIAEDLKLKWCVTEQQLLDNSYYDGTHFYSPILYGLDDNGRLFKVRKRYWAASASNKPSIDNIVNSPAEYVEVDGVFGKPLAVWRGSSSSPLFVKSIIEGNTEWALYGMSTAGASFTDTILQGLASAMAGEVILPTNESFGGNPVTTTEPSYYVGFSVQKVPSGSLQNVRDILSSNSSLSYTSSSATLPRGIGQKMGVQYDAIDDATSEAITANIETTQLIRDVDETIDTHLQVPPTLKDESISIEFVYDKINSGFNYDYSQPPYSIRENGANSEKETGINGLLLLSSPHMIKLNVDQSSANINNPSNAPYTAEIEWYRVEDGQHMRIDSDDPNATIMTDGIGSLRQYIGRGQVRQRDYLAQAPQTSTTALTPCIGVTCRKSVPMEDDVNVYDVHVYIPKSVYKAAYKSKNVQLLQDEGNTTVNIYNTATQSILSDGKIIHQDELQYQISNNYIQPVADVGMKLSADIDLRYYPHYKEHKITDSFFLDELSNFRDTHMSSFGRVNSVGTKLKCVFSLINEFGRSSYEVTDPRFYDFIHDQDLRDEYYTRGQDNWLQNNGENSMFAFINDELGVNVNTLRAGTDYRLKLDTRGTSWSGHPRKYIKQTLVFEDGTEAETDWTDEHEPIGSDGFFDRYTSFTAPTIADEVTFLSYIRIIADDVPGDIGSDRRIEFNTPTVLNGRQSQQMFDIRN